VRAARPGAEQRQPPPVDLRNTGLVADRRDGQFVVYRINIPVWRQAADGFFDHLLEGSDGVTLQNFRIERSKPSSARSDA
jgi:hypothetical protein